ncbi:MAG: rod shape-determining protein RodA, partial [Crocinitomicaceae bacterium]|nr:rod shape-determining protein RodA [Crocinitomicaceae bacterium]
MRKNQSLTGGIDWILLAVVLLLMVMGVATVYSTAYNADHPSLFDFSQKYGKQVIWMGVSLFLGLLVFLIDSYIYRKFAVPIYLFTIALLIIVLFMPEKNGAHSWLGIGSMGIQPAEFAKIGTAILLARFLSSTNLNRQNRKTVLRANYIIIIPMILILLQPDAGTFIVFGSFLFVLYREGISFDPIILFFVNLIPGVRFKHSWIGVHFIPILFVTIFLSVATLIISDQQWEIIEGTEISGYWKVFTFLICLVVV